MELKLVNQNGQWNYVYEGKEESYMDIKEIVNDKTVKYYARGTKDEFQRGIESGRIVEPVKLNADVYLDKRGTFCVVERQSSKEESEILV